MSEEATSAEACLPQRLFVVVAAPPAVRCPADLAGLEARADLVELRFDLLCDGVGMPTPALLHSWIEASLRPVLATWRSRAQGGAFAGSAAEAARRLGLAAAAGAGWLDAEEDVLPLLPPLPPGTRVVFSTHGRGGHVARAASRCDWIKEAVAVDTAVELARFDAGPLPSEPMHEATGPLRFRLPFGAFGPLRATRAGPEAGPALVFGAADAASGVVRGQADLARLLDGYRAGEVTPRAARFGLLGRPGRGSLSALLHAAVFRALGRDAVYVDLPDVEWDEALASNFAGFSVTAPLKARALGAAKTADPWAHVVGVANTLVQRSGNWHALNTDAEALAGFAGRPTARRGVVVMGAGDTARTAVATYLRAGWAPRIVARHAERGRLLAAQCSVPYAGPRVEVDADDEWIVQTTAFGFEDDLPLGLVREHLAGRSAIEAIYRADGRPTALGRVAAQGATGRYIDGRSWLTSQAIGQARAFNVDAELPADLGSILALALEVPPTLVLVGPRGAGKTTVGRALGRRLGRPFRDLDEEIERTTGRGVAEQLRNSGEAAFRRLEEEMLPRLLAWPGAVVALGGGTLESPGARHALAQSAACCFFLHAPAEVLAQRCAAAGETARPRLLPDLSADAERHALLARRLPYWREAADGEVDAAQPLADVVESLVRRWLVSADERQRRARWESV